jgi:GAF domain-containing protein
VAFDVGEDVVWVANPDLPETRSEAALPLRARGQAIGVLDVQSTEAEAFSDEDVTVLQSLADQVAVAIDNARLLQQAQESIAAERRALGELDRERWGTFAREEGVSGYRSDAQGTVPTEETWHPEMVEAVRGSKVVLSPGEQATAAIPIQVRGQVIGVIDGGKPGGEAWTDQEIELLQTLTEQLGVALEGSRLYRETQRRAAREQVIAETTSRMREPLDLENVLQTAVGEMRRVLDLDSLAVRLTIPEAADDAVAGGGQ